MSSDQLAFDDSLDEEPGLVVPEPEELLQAATREERYLKLLTNALQQCAHYKPKFGKGGKTGVSLQQFQEMYGADPFYSWVGLDSPLMYAAHKAAGGMTSIYRQLGIGGEWVFRNVIRDSLQLSRKEAIWSYEAPSTNGKMKTLTLDGRIQFDHIRDRALRATVEEWANDAAAQLALSQQMRKHLNGVVFEVRQGYKSKDLKRQNADILNAASAYTNFYMPVLVILSTQIDGTVAGRYTQNRWLLLTGTRNGVNTSSTYSFCRDVLNYDLAGFFENYSVSIKTELEKILNTLLEA